MHKNLVVNGTGVWRAFQRGTHIHKSLCWGEQSEYMCAAGAPRAPRGGMEGGPESLEAGAGRPGEGRGSSS